MARPSPRPLPTRLEEALAARFETRAQLVFTTAVAAGQLPLAGYYTHLCAWATIWGEVEALAAEDPPAVWSDDLRFAGLLRADRAYLAPLCGEPEAVTLQAADALARQVRTAFRAERVTLLGTIYALERVLADAQTIDGCAHRAYGLTISGRSFWRYQVLGAGERLRELTDRLLAIDGGGRAADRIEAAARATLGSYLDVERTIQPGTDLASLAPTRTPPGALLPPRPNQGPGAPGWGILRGSPNGRRPR
jgi:hypothetical protein